MTYPINQNLNQYPQTSTGINNPQFQNVNGNKIKQGISENHAIQTMQTNGENTPPWLTPLLSIPVWAGLAAWMSNFNSKCGGDYPTTLLWRIETFGDNVSKKFPWLENFAQNIAKRQEAFMQNTVPKYEFLDAFFNRKTSPENSMVKMMAAGTEAELATDALSKFHAQLDEGKKLVLAGKELTLAEIEKMQKSPHTKETIGTIIKICEDRENKDFHLTKFGQLFKSKYYISDIPGFSKIFGSKGQWSEYANKLRIFDTRRTASALGKILPKTMLRIVESITNGTAGGRAAIFMAAWFIADSIKMAINAPKGEKISTFMESNASGMGFYLTMPLGIGLMHKMGGLRYLGIPTEKVKEYRDALVNFNKKAAEGGFPNKQAYKDELKALKELVKVDIKGSKIGKFFKNLLYKPFRGAAKMLTVGLDTARGFRGNSSLGKLANNIGYYLKFGAGYPVRFFFYLLVIGPFLGNLFARLSNAIFGKPTKSILDSSSDEENKTKTPAQNNLAQPVVAPQQTGVQTQVPVQAVQPNEKLNHIPQTEPLKRENLIDMYNTKPTNPEAHGIIAAESQEPARTYLPSSQGVVIEEQKDPKVEAVLGQSYQAENVAGKYIPKR